MMMMLDLIIFKSFILKLQDYFDVILQKKVYENVVYPTLFFPLKKTQDTLIIDLTFFLNVRKTVVILKHFKKLVRI